MERAAVITDIHANLPALEATLARIEELGADAVYCGGDLVGYGPHPTEVCRLIEERIARSTATTTTRSPATTRIAAAPTSTSTTASSASAR